MMVGATANETMSESESISTPIGELTFNIRAEKPSKKSKKAEARIR